MTHGHIENDRTSARMPEQVNSAQLKPLGELGEIIGMLDYRKILATSVPSFGEVMAKADRNDATR
jgi:hypothetical protein